MDRVLVLADSEVLAVEVVGGLARVRLAAAAVRDVAGEHGWLAGVVLTLEAATATGEIAPAFGRLRQGRVVVDGRPHDVLTLPGALEGAVALSLEFANGAAVALHGRTLVLAAPADARFTPDLSC